MGGISKKMHGGEAGTSQQGKGVGVKGKGGWRRRLGVGWVKVSRGEVLG